MHLNQAYPETKAKPLCSLKDSLASLYLYAPVGSGKMSLLRLTAREIDGGPRTDAKHPIVPKLGTANRAPSTTTVLASQVGRKISPKQYLGGPGVESVPRTALQLAARRPESIIYGCSTRAYPCQLSDQDGAKLRGDLEERGEIPGRASRDKKTPSPVVGRGSRFRHRLSTANLTLWYPLPRG